MRRRRLKRRPARSRITGIFVLLVGLGLLSLITYLQLRPAVESAAAYQVNLFATRIINAAILEQLGERELGYGDFIRLTYNNSGDIVAIESDMASINRLKADVTGAVIASLEEMGTATLRLPMGTLMGNELTAGRGPMVEIRIYPVGYVHTNLYSNFTEAGINQTMHQITLGTRVQMRAVIPGYNIRTEVNTSFGVAETVIVGNIPDAYAQISLGEVPAIARVGG